MVWRRVFLCKGCKRRLVISEGIAEADFNAEQDGSRFHDKLHRCNGETYTPAVFSHWERQPV